MVDEAILTRSAVDIRDAMRAQRDLLLSLAVCAIGASDGDADWKHRLTGIIDELDELIDQIESDAVLVNRDELARRLGVTPARVSQLRGTFTPLEFRRLYDPAQDAHEGAYIRWVSGGRRAVAYGSKEDES